MAEQINTISSTNNNDNSYGCSLKINDYNQHTNSPFGPEYNNNIDPYQLYQQEPVLETAVNDILDTKIRRIINDMVKDKNKKQDLIFITVCKIWNQVHENKIILDQLSKNKNKTYQNIENQQNMFAESFNSINKVMKQQIEFKKSIDICIKQQQEQKQLINKNINKINNNLNTSKIINGIDIIINNQNQTHEMINNNNCGITEVNESIDNNNSGIKQVEENQLEHHQLLLNKLKHHQKEYKQFKNNNDKKLNIIIKQIKQKNQNINNLNITSSQSPNIKNDVNKQPQIFHNNKKSTNNNNNKFTQSIMHSITKIEKQLKDINLNIKTIQENHSQNIHQIQEKSLNPIKASLNNINLNMIDAMKLINLNVSNGIKTNNGNHKQIMYHTDAIRWILKKQHGDFEILNKRMKQAIIIADALNELDSGQY